ncbi:hypothetical protein ACFOWB_12845 [Chenggangzhangella methanolivorans]|uniref:hypothetical protein n=1 Tax=Chenggangzhangella methanolivorans TaxID=1437009 RepID=UPI00360DC17C
MGPKTAFCFLTVGFALTFVLLYVCVAHILANDEFAGEALGAIATLLGVYAALGAAWFSLSGIKGQLSEMRRQSAATALQALQPVYRRRLAEAKAIADVKPIFDEMRQVFATGITGRLLAERGANYADRLDDIRSRLADVALEEPHGIGLNITRVAAEKAIMQVSQFIRDGLEIVEDEGEFTTIVTRASADKVKFTFEAAFQYVETHKIAALDDLDEIVIRTDALTKIAIKA